jgi:TonB family protein
LQRQGAEGDTLLSFVVTAGGRVKDIRVAKSSSNKGLDWAATVCASHWNYKPATQDGTPIDMHWKALVVWTVPTDVPDDGSRGQPTTTPKT